MIKKPFRRVRNVGRFFISEIGKHSRRSLIKDLEIDRISAEANKIKKKGKIELSDFTSLASAILTRTKFARGGLKINSNVKVKSICDFLTSKSEENEISFLEYSCTKSRGLGNNKKDLKSKYFYAKVHYGKPTSLRIKRQLSQPNIELTTDIVKDSQKMVGDNYRNQLVIRSGFNQKSYSFLKDIAYIDSSKFMSLYKNKMRQLIKNEKKNALKEYYTSTYSIKNKLKFINRSDYFNTKIKIHMVFLKNPEMDLDKLISEVFWFEHEIDQELNENVRECNVNEGKMLRENQVDFPSIETLKSKIKNSFIFDYENSLNDSLSFRKNCYVAKTFIRTLGPFDILELSITTHLGDGLCLNELVNKHCKNKKLRRSVSHFFIVECLGDKRCRLYKTETKGDVFYTGFSPSKISFESKLELKSLTTGIYNEDYLTYLKSKKKEKTLRTSPLLDLDQNGIIDRTFNVAYQDIDFTTQDNDKKYRVEYDISGNSNEESNLGDLKQKYFESNEDPDVIDQLNEEDLLEYSVNINNPNIIEENNSDIDDNNIKINWNDEPESEIEDKIDLDEYE